MEVPSGTKLKVRCSASGQAAPNVAGTQRSSSRSSRSGRRGLGIGVLFGGDRREGHQSASLESIRGSPGRPPCLYHGGSGRSTPAITQACRLPDGGGELTGGLDYPFVPGVAAQRDDVRVTSNEIETSESLPD